MDKLVKFSRKLKKRRKKETSVSDCSHIVLHLNNKYKNLGSRNEIEIRKTWHREAIYGQTRQIISKTKKEA